MTHARILYDACPLCGCQAITDVGMYDCSSHELYKPELPTVMNWCECFECRHMFTDGYFSAESLAVLFSRTHDNQEPGHDPERGRRVWSRVVEQVTAFHGAAAGRWLDVGFGDGTLLFTAQEWGYEPLGIDLRRSSVEKLVALGVPARALALESLDEPEGLLFLSTPNKDTVSWRVLEREQRNAYLIEIEHYHNFSRGRFYDLLVETGFSPVWYGVSQRYLCGMEVIARRTT